MARQTFLLDADHALTGALEHLLTARLHLLVAWHTHHFVAGAHMPETLVPTDRLIWLEQGTLNYCFEGIARKLDAGAIGLIPAWTRRSWQSSKRTGCRLSWIEFSVQIPVPILPVILLEKTPPDLVYSLQRLLATPPAEKKASLLAEMDLKHLLAHLFMRGSIHFPAVGAEDRLPIPIIQLMKQHLHDPRLITRLPHLAGLSARSLRQQFRDVTGSSPGRYLEGLRMRQARFLLASSPLSVKEIAAQVGFDDPLYFSRRYRLFWGQPPTEDRAPSP